MNPWLWAPALFPCVLTLLNVLFWPYTRAGQRPAGRVSALVPARNEAANLDACLRALCATDADEILVLDDASTDETAAIVGSWARRDARVQLLEGHGPPAGWLGKAAACERLLQASTGDFLLFIDADVRVAPDALLHLGSLQMDIITAVPRQETVSFAERLVIPLLYLSYLSWLLMPVIRWSRRPSVLAANGQFVFARRAALLQLGGFGCVRQSVVDDMALMRAARCAGLRVDFMDGTQLAVCRMYRSAEEVADGFSKNLYPGIGASPLALGVVIGLYILCFLLPWLVWPWAPVALVGIITNLLQRLLIALRFQQRPLDIFLHPLSILAFLAIALRSAWWSWSKTARWRGRSVAV